jgi:cytoskeletal protein CcmA (bactofilin family)
VTGALTVSGAITGGSLNTAGNINGGTLNVSGASALHGTSVTGNLTASGTISAGGNLTAAGNLTVTGVATVGTMPSLYVTGNTSIDGGLGVGGSISGAASLSVTGAITGGASLHITGNTQLDGTLNVNGAITGASLSVSGAIAGASLSVSGAITGGAITGTSLHITGNGTIDGALAISGAVTAASFSSSSGKLTGNIIEAAQYNILEGGTSYIFAGIGTDIDAIATLILGPEFATSNLSRLAIYSTGQNYYKANEHNFWSAGPSYSTFAVFNSVGTANASGSWNVICDDSIKENVQPYTSGLAEILQLNPVSFNYVASSQQGTIQGDTTTPVDPFVEGRETPPTRYGLMASNAQEVIPEMVAEMTFTNIPNGPAENTPLATIAPTHLVWVLINACKELDTRHKALDTRVAALESAP